MVVGVEVAPDFARAPAEGIAANLLATPCLTLLAARNHGGVVDAIARTATGQVTVAFRTLLCERVISYSGSPIEVSDVTMEMFLMTPGCSALFHGSKA